MFDTTQFARWFAANANDLRAELSDDLRAQLIDFMDSAGFDDWEIGPLDASGEVHFLAIAPFLEDEVAVMNRASVLALSPPPGWKFLAYKPPKHWSRRIKWKGNVFDVRFWKFSLNRVADDLFDIQLIDQLEALGDKEDRLRIAYTALDSELGQQIMHEHIRSVTLLEPSIGTDPAETFTIDEIASLVRPIDDH